MNLEDSELAELINSFSNQNLVDSSSDEETDMTEARAVIPTPTINYQLLKLYVDTIPLYDGNNNTLEIFINSCDYLFNTYGNFNDTQLKEYLLRVVIGKLTGRAQILIGSRGELNTWCLVKEALRQSFGDQRNLGYANSLSK